MTDEERRERRTESSRRYRASHLEQCRAASRRAAAAWREEHRDRYLASNRRYDEEHREERLAYQKEYAAAHPEKKRLESKIFRERHPDRARSAERAWAKAHPEMRREAARRLRASDPQRARAKDKAKRKKQLEAIVLRSVVGRMMRGEPKVHGSKFYIGCNAGFLRNHLEAQFKPGMTWDNWGDIWHIDHIVPLAWWDLKKHPEHLPFASHYSNLQPLFKAENMSKGARHAA